MKGIFPWETLSHNYFTDSITWEFSCLEKSTKDPGKLEEFWLPDQHDLTIRVIIKFDKWDETMGRVLSFKSTPKWMLSWNSVGTNRCGSSDLVSNHQEYVDIQCVIPAGSCAKNLILEPVAISTGGRPDKSGLFSPPPGAILTRIDPLSISFGEAPAFPLYEIYGEGTELLKWSIPDDLADNLHEDMSRLIVAEVDLNHEFLKKYQGEADQAVKQKKGLLYNIIISDYLRIICSDEDIVRAVEEKVFLPGTAGYSIRWLLTELAGHCNFSEVRDLYSFFRKNPEQITKTVNRVFSTAISK
jgi:hypothetical protein